MKKLINILAIIVIIAIGIIVIKMNTESVYIRFNDGTGYYIGK